jgi:hypothetical protein
MCGRKIGHLRRGKVRVRGGGDKPGGGGGSSALLKILLAWSCGSGNLGVQCGLYRLGLFGGEYRYGRIKHL